MTPRQALQARIDAEFSRFIEFPAGSPCADVTVVSTKLFAEHMVEQECARLQAGHDRYEAVRKMSPRQFAKLYMTHIRTGERFDDLVDKIVAEQQA